jgi:hypothetical protein
MATATATAAVVVINKGDDISQGVIMVTLVIKINNDGRNGNAGQ